MWRICQLLSSDNRLAMFSAWSRGDDEMDRSLSVPSHLELTLSSSVVEIPPTSPEAQEPLEDLQFANADDDHDYACKYCHKKFSNKQALGGHQNAHKMERAMDKGAVALTENQFGYFNFDGPSSYPLMETPIFVRPLSNRSHEFLSGATANLPEHPPQPVHQEVHMGQFARSLHPTDGMPYAPRPVPGLAHMYPGWNAPVSSMYRFVAPPSHLQYDAPNAGYLPYGFGSSSAQPVFDAHPTCTGSGPITDEDLGHQNNNQMNNPENVVEDPDLDLSLRL